MKWRSAGQLKWLEYEIFADCPELVHATFSRKGGYSRPPFDSFNLGDGLGDREEAVAANRALVCGQLGVPSLVYAQQVHKTQLIEVTPEPPSECDGFILRHQGTAAMIKHADCQAAIFYDPVNKVAANVHAGWRGLVQNIYQVTVERLKSYGCKPENLLVAIAPSLGPEAAEFVNYKQELPEPFWEHQVEPTYFDLWEIANQQLQECGILPHHREITRISTYAHPENFFSYRRDKQTGRHGTIVALR